MGLNGHVQGSCAASTNSPTWKAAAKTSQRPAWAAKKDNRRQPWKVHQGKGVEDDSPMFAEVPDYAAFYNAENKVCLGEGSMAA